MNYVVHGCAAFKYKYLNEFPVISKIWLQVSTLPLRISRKRIQVDGSCDCEHECHKDVRDVESIIMQLGCVIKAVLLA